LKARLRAVGFTTPYLKKVAALPEWWDDSLWDDPMGRAEGYIHLSRHLGIDIQSLQDPSSPLRLKNFGTCKYKKQAGTTEAELLLSRVIATRAAHFAIAATAIPNGTIPSAEELRDAILDQNDWVGFTQLVEWCWSNGIPVIHVNNFPSEAKKKPTGFTLRHQGQPAIVLCAEYKQPSRQLFVLAHELGHLSLDHVPVDGALLDEKVEEDGTAIDSEEREADRFAVHLLTGNPHSQLDTGGNWPSATDLAKLARDYGLRNGVDPGHVILNWAHSMGEVWHIANAALKLLVDQFDAVDFLAQRLTANLDWNRLPEADSAFLSRITRQEYNG